MATVFALWKMEKYELFSPRWQFEDPYTIELDACVADLQWEDFRASDTSERNWHHMVFSCPTQSHELGVYGMAHWLTLDLEISKRRALLTIIG